MPTTEARLMEKTDFALIYSNELPVTIKVIIKRLKRQIRSEDLGNYKSQKYITKITTFLLRRIIMRTLKIVLLVVALLFVGIIAGCQEGHALQNNSPKWEPTGTGFWRPVVTAVEAK